MVTVKLKKDKKKNIVMEDIIAAAIRSGKDVSHKQKRIMKASVEEADIEHARSENISDEEWECDIKKAFKCLHLKDKDGDFLCVLVGHGNKGEEEKNYMYFWFIWEKKNGKYEYYNFMSLDTVDDQGRVIQY